jgi:hypothetical protein
MALSWRWSAVPLVIAGWWLLLVVRYLTDLQIDSGLSLLMIMVCLIATGILVSYVLRTVWAVLIVPFAIYAGLVLFAIQFDRPRESSWDVYAVVSSLILITLFLTSGASAWVTSYLMTRSGPVVAGARRMLPLLFALAVYTTTVALWLQTGQEARLEPWEMLVAMPALWLFVLVMLVVGASASGWISRQFIERPVLLTALPGSHSLGPLVLAFAFIAGLGGIFALGGALYPLFPLGFVLLSAAIGAVVTGCFAVGRTESSFSDRLIGFSGIALGMLAALLILFAVY